MELVIKTIQEDAITISLLIAVVGVLMLINILLGTILAGVFKVEKWDWTKFWQGFIKLFVFVLCIYAYCIVLDVIPLIFERIKIKIPQDIVTTLQVIGVFVVLVVKYCKKDYEQILKITGVKKEEVDEIVQTTFNNDPSVMENADISIHEVADGKKVVG